MIRDMNFANQISPAPGETEFVNCKFSHTTPNVAGDGTVEPIRVWPEHDAMETPPQITLTQCTLKNVVFGANVTIVNPGTRAVAVTNAVLGGDVIVTIDGENITVPRRGTIIYGHTAGALLAEPVEMEDCLEVGA